MKEKRREGMNLNLKTKLNMEKTRTEIIIFETIRDFEEETGFRIKEVIIKRPSFTFEGPAKTVKISIDGIV